VSAVIPGRSVRLPEVLVIRRGVVLGLTMGVLIVGCDGGLRPSGGMPAPVMGGGGTTGAAGAPGTAVTPTIPDIHATLLRCDGGLGDVALAMPCLLGMAPVSEVDCALAGDPTQKISFILPLSLPDTTNGEPTVGQPTRFRPTFVPLAPLPRVGGDHVLRDVSGTVVFTSYSLADATFDGSFTHLDVVWASPENSLITCTLDNGRFTAIPGGFL
jgi:hypothetical protein